MKTIIGIDSGSNGCVVIWKNNRIEHMIKMPKNISDLKTYFDYIKENNSEVLVFIEKVQMYHSDSDQENKGKQFRIQKLLANYEQLKSLVVFYEFQFVEVYPISWQSSLGFQTKGMSQTERKNTYKEAAELCFPEKQITLWNADALLILKFGLNKLKYDTDWIVKRLQNKSQKNLFK